MDPTSLPYFGLLDKNFIKKIQMICCAGTRILIVTKSDEVFGFGRLPDCSKYANIFELRPIHQLDKKQVTKFVIYLDFVITLTKKGEVFSWGNNHHGQLGVGYSTQIDVPTIISTLSEKGVIVIDVSCGRNHVMALCKDNSVYAWGKHFGNTPVLIQQSDMKIGITCSEYAAFYLKSNGEVYGKGYVFTEICNSRDHYLLGNSSNPNYTVFDDWMHLKSLNNIVKITAGRRHVIALDSDGAVFVWGSNECTQSTNVIQTSQTISVKLPKIPQKIDFDHIWSKRIIDIAANSFTDLSAVMTENFEIYTWRAVLQGIVISNVVLTSFTTFNEVFIKLSYPNVSIEPITFNLSDTEQTTSKAFKKGSFESIFDLQDDSDFTISVEGKNIFVHKVILKMNSKYFHAMFTNQWKDSDKKILKIDGFSYNSFRSFLSYLYTGEIDATSENVFELIKIADIYSDETLLALIEKKIESSSMSENVIEIVKNVMKLSTRDYETFCDGMRKFMETPTSKLVD